ncbi:Os02g0611000, partial [Oryza sativa Japonica Group]
VSPTKHRRGRGRLLGVPPLRRATPAGNRAPRLPGDDGRGAYAILSRSFRSICGVPHRPLHPIWYPPARRHCCP